MATSKDKMNYWEINLENNLDWVLNLLSNWDNNEKIWEWIVYNETQIK